ncbi:MAG: hypothetical protein JSR24_07495 [Proteobacteria bacterium]|nr:hypothetical protein [Pseudomonadota bacterium]
MNLFAFLDLVGLLLTTFGALLLTFPTLSDIVRRRELAGISVWLKLATTTSTSGTTPPAGADRLEAAGQRIEAHGVVQLPKDLRRVGWGVALIILGLLLSIPVKIQALWAP